MTRELLLKKEIIEDPFFRESKIRNCRLLLQQFLLLLIKIDFCRQYQFNVALFFFIVSIPSWSDVILHLLSGRHRRKRSVGYLNRIPYARLLRLPSHFNRNVTFIYIANQAILLCRVAALDNFLFPSWRGVSSCTEIRPIVRRYRRRTPRINIG